MSISFHTVRKKVEKIKVYLSNFKNFTVAPLIPPDPTNSYIHFGSRVVVVVVWRGTGGAAMHSRTGGFTSNLPDISLHVL